MSKRRRSGISQAAVTAVFLALSRHIGRDRGITARVLAQLLEMPERQVRKAVSALRGEGHLVCGRPESGYFIGQTRSEIDETCAFLRGRAMHSLTLEARMRQVGLPELLGQLRLKT